MSNQTHLHRRTFLKGLGAAVSLPLLESMNPVRALGGAAPVQPPVRMAFLFVPNGVHIQEWKPEVTGAHYDLPRILHPLSPVTRALRVPGRFTQAPGRPTRPAPGPGPTRPPADAGCDVIMLDNMDAAMMVEAVAIVAGRCELEASGGIDLDTVREKAMSGVDYISVGRITHSAPAADIGLDVRIKT